MSHEDIRKKLQKYIDDEWRRMNEADLERVKADPASNKLTTLFEGDLTYRYLKAGSDGRGREVRYCWSTKRNAAGYFLGWREVANSDGSGKRDQWSARKVKRRLIELAERRSARHKSKHEDGAGRIVEE